MMLTLKEFMTEIGARIVSNMAKFANVHNRFFEASNGDAGASKMAKFANVKNF